jgi:hypothetical protein
MSIEELVYRLKERIRAPFRSEKRFIRVLSRFSALALFAAVISTLAPTLADELASSPEIMQPAVDASPSSSAAPTTPDSSTAGATPTPTADPIIIRSTAEPTSPAPLVEPTDSPTVVVLPPAPLEVQPRYTLRIPSSVAVDPRAKFYLMPHIYAASGDDSHATMVCISGSNDLLVDSRNKLSAQNLDSGPDLISGDRSSFLMISASTQRVVNLINSWSGLQVYSLNTGIANKVLTFQFIAVTRPVIDPAFCSAARSTASTVIRPLGLEQSTVKGSGTLK